MLKYLHDTLLGHTYYLSPYIEPGDDPIFECRCGDEWYPGFTLKTLGHRDHFEPFALTTISARTDYAPLGIAA